MSRASGASVLLAILISAPSITCGGGPTDPGGGNTPVLSSITVSPSSYAFVAFDESTQFTATAKDQSGRTMTGVSFTWSSTNPSTAGVSNGGMVTAKGAGQAAVRATSGTVSGSATITVQQAASSVVVAPETDIVTAIGATRQFTATARDANGHTIAGSPVLWSSSVPGVATISPTGLVTAVANGTTTIKAAVGAVEGLATLTVSALDSVAVSPHFAATRPGVGVALAVEALAGGLPVANPTLQITSRNGTVATVSGSTVIGQTPGTADIVAESGAVRDSARIAVVQTGGFAVLVSASPSEFATEGDAGQTMVVSLRLIRPAGGSGEIASLQGRVEWDSSVLSYQASGGIEPAWSWVPNDAGAGSGYLHFGAFAASGTTASFTLAQFQFTLAGPAGSSSPISVVIDVAGDSLGGDIASLLVQIDGVVEVR